MDYRLYFCQTADGCRPLEPISDYRLVPWLSLLYLLSFLDRSNIGNANLFGLSKHLKLSQNQYSACLAVFFATYVMAEVPSNMCMKAWR